MVESGNHNYGEIRKHGSGSFRCHLSVSTFILSPWLGSARKIGIHPGISLVDPGDTALRRRRRRRRRSLLPLSPTAATADAAVGRYHFRLWPLSPLVTSVAAVDCRLHRPPPTPPSAAPTVTAGRCKRRPPFSLTAAAAAAASAVGRYHCRLRPLPPPVTVAAVVDCRLRRPPPPPSSDPVVAVSRSCRRCRPLLSPPAMVDPGPPLPPRLVEETLGTGAIPA